ncbi:hypothetical protein BT69DRAFT_1353464 [Atractiella rhizophila]|nr:hypothetical protein BT69DRAFT_1353464 [Atractiella rhizophila]
MTPTMEDVWGDISRFPKLKSRGEKSRLSDSELQSFVQTPREEDSVAAARAFLQLTEEVLNLGKELDVVAGKLDRLEKEAGELDRWAEEHKTT